MKARMLQDVRVADLTWAGAGPFGTKVFSDFGAEVIKVESSKRLDSVRTGGPFKDRIYGVNRSGYFASRNTGKKSLVLDLKSQEGRDVVFDLISRSDVVSNNFGPGAMARLGLDYETVRGIKPDIVYLSMPMYGKAGPLANLLGVGMTISAVTGLMWSTAYEEDDPVGPGTHYPDHAANPYHAAFAVLAALRYRRLTGHGMEIDLSQVESTLNFIGAAFTEYSRSGEEPPIVGNGHAAAAPHGIYPATGDDAWVAISVMNDVQWLAFASAIGRDDLARDVSLAGAGDRVPRREELDAMVAEWTAERSPEGIVSTMTRAGVPAAVVANSRYLAERDDHLAERGYWQRVPHPELGASLYCSPPFRIDEERVELDRPPLLGEHTTEILEVLGRDRFEIDRLEEAGALK